MKAWLFLLTALLVIPQFAFAQETLEPSEWTTEQRCVTTFTEPPDGWTFDGVIFTFRQGDGVHARRADLPSRYYVAFDNNSEHGGLGSFSPDGQWYAVPYGLHQDADKSSLDNQFHVGGIRIYSTVPQREIYVVEADWTEFVNAPSREGIAPRWLDDDQFIYPVGSKMRRTWVEVNPFTGETFPYYGLVPLSTAERALEVGLPAEVVPVQTSYSGSGFGFLPYVDRSIFSADQQFFSYQHPALHIGNVNTHHILDTCIQSEFMFRAFSPDNEQLAFGLNEGGFVYILDLEAWEAYRIDLAANDVIGWYPIS